VEPVVRTREEWREARLALLEREKQLTRLRDEVAAERRELPWVPVETEYVFDTLEGERSLTELFDGRSQLVIYHFMMGPDWEEGCPSCSFWSDTYNGNGVHLAARDVTFLCASRAPLDSIEAYRRRMGWDFRWVSSLRSTFNFDFGVSFQPGQESGEYNFAEISNPGEENPGISVFAMHEGVPHHTYSAYARGLDPLNGAYQILDLVPKGRDEDDLPWTMDWLRRHDQYT
jgi:predicted dithiol-disulfide oxidoreductase (DUF899 family)